MTRIHHYEDAEPEDRWASEKLNEPLFRKNGLRMKPTFNRTIEVETLEEFPLCNFCVWTGEHFRVENDSKDNVRYDGPTRQGPRANMCPRHFEMSGFGSVAIRFVLKEKAK
jgi:hypothetical protein